MGNALQKANRLNIPTRDKAKIAAPKAAISEQSTHDNQVKNAFDFGFARYEKAMKKLAKV
ncbi:MULTISPECIES: hypothetical protein [Providencia]|uniref:Uncharacterized protein n=1 Tax=Providencia heimbachae ATCC 35613 TaxID=1354272 RepID=A0A1B7K4S8_9GAMM|nr:MULTISPECIES: hypothetical protein [Providencia]MBP6121463.1 hypothetical protein [Providencia sp.]NIH22651.1 hypothetical protein [Providencia heimbachae]OAT55024.1 hypothetical protein M998_0174 [Providencia heimbachae ATCC 35613]QCJ70008.1 hypothetical protein C9446_09190 [Providencia heimbachae]SQH13210.1 Uncharacterised protein [Providencia heimbachae]